MDKIQPRLKTHYQSHVRKKLQGDDGSDSELSAVSEFLFASKCDEAKKLLDQLEDR